MKYMIHKIITKTIKHSKLFKTTDIMWILHRSFIFTENIYIVKVDTAEVNDMLG